MCIEDLNIYKGVGEYAYTNFFFILFAWLLSNKGLVPLYKYIQSEICNSL